MKTIIVRDEFASMLEHSLLAPGTTENQVLEGCRFAVAEGVKLVMVQPCFAEAASHALRGTPVLVGAVLGFPHGCDLTDVKVLSARRLRALGADEMDMVLNRSLLRSGRTVEMEADIRAVVEAAGGATVKVILETGELSEKETALCVETARKAGADFVKTSTGFAGTGATVEAVSLLRRLAGKTLGVKASGGIRTLDQAMALIEAGADRLGLSATPDVLAEWDKRFGNGR
jgi:deoxyribose-phosphate aldolase